MLYLSSGFRLLRSLYKSGFLGADYQILDILYREIITLWRILKLFIRKFRFHANIQRTFHFNISFSGKPYSSEEFPNLSNMKFYSSSQNTVPKARTYPISVALARIECERVSEHSTRSDRVTDIGYVLALGASTLACGNSEFPPRRFAHNQLWFIFQPHNIRVRIHILLLRILPMYHIHRLFALSY